MPVAEGSATTLAGLAKTRIADFVHGSDGFGNTDQAAVEVTALPCLHTSLCLRLLRSMSRVRGEREQGGNLAWASFQPNKVPYSRQCMSAASHK